MQLLGGLRVGEQGLRFLLGDLRRTRLESFKVHAYHLLKSAKTTRGRPAQAMCRYAASRDPMHGLRGGELRASALLPGVRNAAGSPVRYAPGAPCGLRPVRRSRGVHLEVRATRPRGRPVLPDRLLRASAGRDRAVRRPGREVHRRRGDGGVRGAGRLRRRPGASGPGRDGRAGLDRRHGPGRSAVGAPGPGGGQHGRGDRRVERPSGRRRGDGRRGRGEHGGPVAEQRAGQRGARRPGDVRVDPDGDRVPAGRTRSSRRARPTRSKRGSPWRLSSRPGSGSSRRCRSSGAARSWRTSGASGTWCRPSTGARW